jgi:apolipoprotein N-acyltransferase
MKMRRRSLLLPSEILFPLALQPNFWAIAASMKLSVLFWLLDLGHGWTPWTGDQLVARPLLPAPGDCDDGEVGGMNGFDRGN